jgi:hypothetical protein
MLKIGDRVYKGTGDYDFEGVVIGEIKKLSGAVRYVIEDSRGLLLILNVAQLRRTE